MQKTFSWQTGQGWEVPVFVHICVCMWVCEREREQERETHTHLTIFRNLIVSVFVCFISDVHHQVLWCHHSLRNHLWWRGQDVQEDNRPRLWLLQSEAHWWKWWNVDFEKRNTVMNNWYVLQFIPGHFSRCLWHPVLLSSFSLPSWACVCVCVCVCVYVCIFFF